MKRLLLVRHGESTWNGEGRLQGQRDRPLSERGREQVRELRRVVSGYVIGEAVASDLSRAQETAALLGFPGAKPDPRWREADLGAWTGRSIAGLLDERPEEYERWRSGDFTPPGGEARQALVDRVRSALRERVEARGDVLIVTHGGPIRVVCDLLVGLRPEHMAPVSPASLTVIEVGASPRLLALNVTPRPAPSDPR